MRKNRCFKLTALLMAMMMFIGIMPVTASAGTTSTTIKITTGEGTKVLVVVNFDDVDTEADVVIPRHAFEFLGIDEGQHMAVDLLTDQQTEVMLGYDKPVTLHLPPCGGVVLKVNIQKKA